MILGYQNFEKGSVDHINYNGRKHSAFPWWGYRSKWYPEMHTMQTLSLYKDYLTPKIMLSIILTYKLEFFKVINSLKKC